MANAATNGSVLSRIGQGVISFGSGQSKSQIETTRANRQIADQNVELGEQDLEANQRALDKDQRREILMNEAFGGGPESDRAKAQFAVEFPEEFEQIATSAGLLTQGQKTEAADFATRLKGVPFDQRQALIDERVNTLSSVGRDPQHTASLTGLSEQDQNDALGVTELLALTPEQRFDLATGGIGGAEQQFFNANIKEMNRIEAIPVDQRSTSDTSTLEAIKIDLGRQARAGTITGQERIAQDPTLTTDVARSEAEIASATEFAKTDARLTAELARADEVGDAAARQAALVEAAKLGERIAAGKIKTAEEARILLPDAQAGALEMVTLLNDIRNDPNLPNVLGSIEGRIDVRLSEAENELLAKIAQVTGKTFLQAYQSLKGGGPITDTEGKAATEAQSRLTNRLVSVGAYQSAIDELIGITDSRLARLTRKAGPAQEAPAAPGAVPEGATATGPNGEKIVFRGGNWVPA